MLHLQVIQRFMLRKYGSLSFSSLLFVFIVSSCHDKNYVAIPKNIIPPDSMVAVIADAHIIQAAAQQGYTQNPKDTTIQMAYESMYKKHHINDSMYNQSLKFYCNNARLLDSVYEKVLNTLNQQKIELMGPKQGPGKKN